MYVLFLQVFELVLTILQRVFESFVSLNGLLSRTPPPVQKVVPTAGAQFDVFREFFGADRTANG